MPDREMGVSINDQSGRRISIRFQPKRRASMDHAPAPKSASDKQTVANKTLTTGSPCWEKAKKNSSAATTSPAATVHDPIRSSKAAPAAIAYGTDVWSGAQR